MPTPGAHKIDSYWIIPAHDGGSLSKAIKSWQLYGTNDNFATHTLLHTVGSQTFSDNPSAYNYVGKKFAYPLYFTSGLFRDFRIVVEAIQGTDTYVQIYKMGYTLGGVDVCYNMLATTFPAPNITSASHQTGGWESYHAFQASDLLSWMAPWTGDYEWLQYSFGNPCLFTVSPITGIIGESIVLLGQGFGETQGDSWITFVHNAVADAVCTSWSDTSITVIVPDSYIGADTVCVNVVTGDDEFTSNQLPFTRLSKIKRTKTESSNVWIKKIETKDVLFKVDIKNMATMTLDSEVSISENGDWSDSWDFTELKELESKIDVTLFYHTNQTLDSKISIYVPIPAPNITSISPLSGYIGDSVTINGTNLRASQGDSSVYFWGGDEWFVATSIISWSDIEVVCDVPEGAITGEVILATDSGQGTSYFYIFQTTTQTISSKVNIYVMPPQPPTITSITPNHGATNSNVHIWDLKGANFAQEATVSIFWSEAEIDATNVVVVSSTKITCKVDLTEAPIDSVWEVVVTNPNGKVGTLPNAFTVTDVSPSSGKGAIAYVQYVGDETHSHTICAFSSSNDLHWKLNESKWIDYQEFLNIFADEEENIPEYFTVLNILYPDIS